MTIKKKGVKEEKKTIRKTGKKLKKGIQKRGVKEQAPVELEIVFEPSDDWDDEQD